MAIEKELLDQLLAGRDPNEVFANLLDDLKKALSERILNAELDEHLDGERVEGSVNRRNGLESPPKSFQNDLCERTNASPRACTSSCHSPRRNALTPQTRTARTT